MIPVCPNKRHRPGDARHEGSYANAVTIARLVCIGRPSARRPTDAGVSERTPPGINRILEVTWYKQNLGMTWYKQNLGMTWYTQTTTLPWYR